MNQIVLVIAVTLFHASFQVASADPGVLRAVEKVCAGPYPVDIVSLFDGKYNEAKIFDATAQMIIADPRGASDSEFTGNALRLLIFADSERALDDKDLVEWLLLTATPGRRYTGEALAVLRRADKPFWPEIGERISAWIAAPNAPLSTVGGLVSYVIETPVPMAPNALDVLQRVAFDPDYAQRVVSASGVEVHSQSLIAQRIRQNQIHELRARAMLIRLRNGLSNQDFNIYARLDVAGKAAAGHLLLGTLAEERITKLWHDDAMLLHVISLARKIFMDTAVQIKLEASPVGLWMICVNRDDLSVEVRRAMLQAMLDNAHATADPQLIALANQAITDAGFDASKFVPQP